MKGVVTEVELPGSPKVRTGKVRELFDLGNRLLIVATDRISAYDCILPSPIPGKGEVLTQLSAFWFRHFPHVPSHFLTADFNRFPEPLQAHAETLRGRSMLVRKAEPLPVECVVRGYLAGSAWREYQQSRTLAGEPLPDGLELGSPLPTPLFSPATKAQSGHDENISWDKLVASVGSEVADKLHDLSLGLYSDASVHAARHGIIVADTKFEFGWADGELILIDECLTPDSSRFWPAEEYQPGVNPVSFDKQFVRDYLDTLDWDKTPPAPPLPPQIIERTSAKYREIAELLTRG
ncbi:MAG: phosphoribosylaminoimidazolesuccinocarboxamide synthase [Verrucomicrobia bacterium]|nr:phosphoribosylaminoimidazolesuccinocarboxamide synthase [Verrucomicrobiota bacterium]